MLFLVLVPVPGKGWEYVARGQEFATLFRLQPISASEEPCLQFHLTVYLLYFTRGRVGYLS